MINNEHHYAVVINKNNPETPENIITALFILEKTMDGVSIGELMDAFSYELSEISRLYLHGKKYYRDGYRLKYSDDAPVGAANTIVVPSDAVAWCYRETGHVANSERCYYLYVVKVDNK